MGQDKRWLSFNGRPLLQHVVDILRPLVSEVIVVTREPESFPDLDVRTVTDLYAGMGVLAGLHAGLLAARTPWACVVAADLPFLQSPLLRALMERSYHSPADAIVPIWRGYPEPLVALYRPEACIPAMVRLLEQGQRRIADLHAVVQVDFVPEAEIARWDPEGWSFFNINTRSDWELAQHLGAARVE